MALLTASVGARRRQGGGVLARPYDGSNPDLLCGPQASAALTPETTAVTGSSYVVGGSSSQAGYLGPSYQNKQIGFVDGGSGPCQLVLAPGGAAVTNVVSAVPVLCGVNATAPSQLLHMRVATDENAQAQSSSASAALQVYGLVRYCDTSNTSEDGIWPGLPNTGWTIVEDCYEIADPYPAYGGFPYGGTYPYSATYAPGQPNSNTGVFLTAAQVAGATPYAAGMAVTNGEFIVAPINGSVQLPMYQCVSAGTLGTESPGTWPVGPTAVWANLSASETTQPFPSGTADLVYIGGLVHCDAYQFTNQQRVVVRRCTFMDFSNSCALIQNYAGNTNATPVMNITFEDYTARGGGVYDFYVQTQTGDSAYTYSGPSHNAQGGFARVSATNWTVAANPGLSRPWHVSFRRGKHLAATSPHSPRSGSGPVTFNQAMVSYGALFVRSEQVRDQLIAAQFGWDATDQRLAMMRTGSYPYTTQPAPVSSVMEARLQALVSAVGNTALIAANPGACDARTMPVWEPNILNEAGVPITPSTNVGLNYPCNTAVTDAQGYYSGG